MPPLKLFFHLPELCLADKRFVVPYNPGLLVREHAGVKAVS